jgi:hypothetical protein
MDDESSSASVDESGVPIVEDPYTGLPLGADERQNAGVMVYMTPTQRTEFKRWAFHREMSMSHAACEMIAERMAGPGLDDPAPQGVSVSARSDPVPSASGGLLREKAAELAQAVADLAELLWAELEHGSRLPDLARESGLPSEQVQYILRGGAGAMSHCRLGSGG